MPVVDVHHFNLNCVHGDDSYISWNGEVGKSGSDFAIESKSGRVTLPLMAQAMCHHATTFCLPHHSRGYLLLEPGAIRSLLQDRLSGPYAGKKPRLLT